MVVCKFGKSALYFFALPIYYFFLITAVQGKAGMVECILVELAAKVDAGIVPAGMIKGACILGAALEISACMVENELARLAFQVNAFLLIRIAELVLLAMA